MSARYIPAPLEKGKMQEAIRILEAMVTRCEADARIANRQQDKKTAARLGYEANGIRRAIVELKNGGPVSGDDVVDADPCDAED